MGGSALTSCYFVTTLLAPVDQMSVASARGTSLYGPTAGVRLGINFRIPLRQDIRLIRCVLLSWNKMAACGVFHQKRRDVMMMW
jgi:hypothetical protein